MAVKRNAMAQALAKPQGISVQRVAPVATTSQYSDPNAQLAYGEALVNKAVSGQGFDPQGGWGVAAAQIATAGIGAWAQNRARKDIAEKELASQQAFATQYNMSPELASQLSPETRQAYMAADLNNRIKAANPEPLTGIAKLGADYKAGLIDEPTYRSAVKKETSFAPDSSASGGATGAIIANLRRENPNLSYSQALMQAQGLARQGLGFDASGNVAPVAGLMEAKSGVAAAESKGTAVGKKEGELASKSTTAPAVLNLISEAEALLPKATSGRVQNLYTAANQVAGRSTTMSKADSKLDVIAAGLTSNVPRMEGPQSDKDTQLYREAAGNVGNRNLPAGDRIAALQTIKQLNEKYLANKPANNQPRVRTFNPQTGRLE